MACYCFGNGLQTCAALTARSPCECGATTGSGAKSIVLTTSILLHRRGTIVRHVIFVTLLPCERSAAPDRPKSQEPCHADSESWKHSCVRDLSKTASEDFAHEREAPLEASLDPSRGPSATVFRTGAAVATKGSPESLEPRSSKFEVRAST